MAKARLISRSLGSSRKFRELLGKAGKLGEFAQSLYPLLVSCSDDYGRQDGDAFTIKHSVLPISPRTEADFDAALNAMHDVGLIIRYSHNGKQFIQITSFEEHQSGLHKRTQSRIPAPESANGIREIPGNSGKFREIPSEQNRTEQKGTEGSPDGLSCRIPEEDFEKFWKAYPRKDCSKQLAKKAFEKIKPDSVMMDHWLRWLEKACQSTQWADAKYIPHAATWLNQRRWEGEPPAKLVSIRQMTEAERLFPEKFHGNPKPG